MLAMLRDGSWATRERLRAYAAMLVFAYVMGVAGIAGSLRNGLDFDNRPLGSDFAEVYAAGTFVREGAPAAPYDLKAHVQRQREIFGEKTAVFSWNYPPYFLAIAGLLAALPYLAALAVWQLGTLPAYLAATRAWLSGPEALLAALAFPAVFSNLGHGQTGFLAAGLLAGGLAALDRRPFVAGVLFGLLAFKPHFGVLIPLALVAGSHWKAIGSATATLGLMTLATLYAWGPDVWSAFIASTAESRAYGLEYSNTGFYKMQSLFAAVRMLGGPVPLAYALHGTLAVAVAACVVGVWRSAADNRLKSAALILGALLATPYCFDYDMTLEGPALAAMASYLAVRGFGPWEKTLLACAFVAPLLARPFALATHLPLGLASMLALFALVLRHATTDDVRTRSTSRRLAAA